MRSFKIGGRNCPKCYPDLHRDTERRRKEVLNDANFMRGVWESFQSWLRGEKPVPSRDLIRKYDD